MQDNHQVLVYLRFLGHTVGTPWAGQDDPGSLSHSSTSFLLLLGDCKSISLLFCCDRVSRRAEHSS